MTFNPDYVPTGRASKDNPYFKTQNHVRIAKVDRNKRQFFGTIGGVVPSDPMSSPPNLVVSGPFTSANGDDFWFSRIAGPGQESTWKIGFDLDTNPSFDLFVPLMDFLNNTGVSAGYRADVRAQAEALGWTEPN